jgi:Ca2+-binding RTX toxin-like protein
VSGNQAGGWSSFNGTDTYADTGSTGLDRILAVGPGDVDIGLNSLTTANGIERIESAPGTGKVRLLGGWSADTFNFSQVAITANNVWIETGGGNDTVTGSSANDRIDTGSNQDQLIGGLGADLLTGGSGNDTFIFNSVSEIGLVSGTCDLITDFVSKVDKIDLAMIDADTNLIGNQAFIYVGGAAFSGLAGELRLSDQTLLGDINGDSEADFKLGLANVFALSAPTDLLL